VTEVRETESPRLAAVKRHAAELMRIASELGASRVALCGSVARGEDHESSDIDFYVFDFRLTDSFEDRERADRLVAEYRRVLDPYRVDVRGIPGWLLSPNHEATMRSDAIELGSLLAHDS
jgi:predicted nucleotidyltransferase